MIGPCSAAGDGLVERCVVLGLVDLAEFEHAAEHVRPAIVRPGDAGDGVVQRGRPRQACDQRRLGEGQVVHRLVEVHLGRRTDAVGTLPEEDAVQVQGQDFLLREFTLEPHRQEHFLQLAPQGFLRRQHGIARELHRDRAAALADAARTHVRDQRADQALPVDPGVLEETRVFRREERVDDDGGNLVEGHRDAALLADLRQQLAVARIDPQRQLRLHVAQRSSVWNLRGQVLVGPCESHARPAPAPTERWPAAHPGFSS